MRNNGKGGMQTGGVNYSIICPKCGKPAARMELTQDGNRYMHFTKKGVVWHMEPQKGARTMQRSVEEYIDENDCEVNATGSEARHIIRLEMITSSIPLDRLSEICAAENDGRLVELPCWKHVFIISGGVVQEMEMVHYRGNKIGVYDMRCECIDQNSDCEGWCNNENEKACAYNFRIAEIGKTVFLTRAEAEAAKGAAE